MERGSRKKIATFHSPENAKLTDIPQVSDAVNFDLADFQDIQHMNLMSRGGNDKKIDNSLSSLIAINGIQVTHNFYELLLLMC